MNEIIANDLHALLANNIVSFTYRKVNGEIRHAVGTRNIVLAENHTSQYIPRPLGAEQPNSYYDVEKMGWRSYKPENLISIDRVNNFDYATSEPIQQTKKGELPKREIPVSKPIGGAEIHTPTPALDGIFGGLTGSIFGGGIPQAELQAELRKSAKDLIRKSMEDLDKDIVIGTPAHNPKVGTSVATERGIELPIGGVPVEDFAKMVAHYVVEEIISRIKG